MDKIAARMIRNNGGNVDKAELVPIGSAKKKCIHKQGDKVSSENVRLKYFEYDGKAIGMVGTCKCCGKSYYWVY